MSTSGDNKLFSKSLPLPGGKSKNDKKSNAVDLAVLDHNNMAKTFVMKKPPSHPPRLVKTSRAPPTRQYPGVLRSTKTGPPKGAVYAEDLEREEEEMRLRYMENADLTIEDLMRDPDYLKIDQSKLPLEIFDNIELEMLDKSPADWLSTGCDGKAPYYHKGEWIWRPVKILGYNDVAVEWDVRFLPDGIRKNVHRLNLQFDAENAVLFSERRSVAEAARQEAKQIMRLDHFILQQPNDKIRAIRKECIKRIHERVVDGLAVSIPFPEPGTVLGNLLRNLTGDIIRFYTW